MPSKLSIVVAPVALVLLASVAFGAEPEAQQDEASWPGLDFVVPNTRTTCLEGFGTIECKSIRLIPDPEDCPAGQSLIAMRGYGHLRHVCVPGQ
jgi:hypothetical protein